MKPILISPFFIVKSGSNGMGVFALIDFEVGQTLFSLDGLVLKQPTQTSVQIGKEMHVENRIAGYVNHHCLPTSLVDQKNKQMVAIRKIKKGDEITFDYNVNEEQLACPFKCTCCGKMIVGKKELVSS